MSACDPNDSEWEKTMEFMSETEQHRSSSERVELHDRVKQARYRLAGTAGNPGSGDRVIVAMADEIERLRYDLEMAHGPSGPPRLSHETTKPPFDPLRHFAEWVLGAHDCPGMVEHIIDNARGALEQASEKAKAQCNCGGDDYGAHMETCASLKTNELQPKGEPPVMNLETGKPLVELSGLTPPHSEAAPAVGVPPPGAAEDRIGDPCPTCGSGRIGQSGYNIRCGNCGWLGPQVSWAPSSVPRTPPHE